MKAFFMPCCLVLDCLVKKLTFMGIMGNTQGVSKAAKPPRKPARKMAQVDMEVASTAFSLYEAGSSIGPAAVSPGITLAVARVSFTKLSTGAAAARPATAHSAVPV